tara:strand:- start:3504 stop:4196 length:693 start_codon:yes stop_codon:yes gene_type:complete
MTKKTITLGCSFTAQYDPDVKPWPKLFRRLGHKVYDYSLNGSSNYDQFTKLVWHLSHSEADNVYWLMTEFDRITFGSTGNLNAVSYDNNPDLEKHYMEFAKAHKNPDAEKWVSAQVKEQRMLSEALSKTSLQYWVDHNVTLAMQAHNICKAYNINLKIIQGIHPLNYYLHGYDKAKVIKAFIKSSYISPIDHLNCIIDHPDWKSKYSFSQYDNHPNQAGADYIFNLFANK